MRIRIRLLLLIFPFLTAEATAQCHQLLNPRIHTLQVVAGDDWLGLPVITLNGNDPINIAFDDFTHEYHRYTYRVEHCEADWSVSEGVFKSEYLEGFGDDNEIDDYEESFNTNTLYTHYRFQIPNRYCQLKISGNYRVTVFDDNNNQEVMLRAYFMVVEPRMGVTMQVSSNTDIDVNRQHQQLTCAIDYAGLSVTDPQQQVKTVVLQNGRWDDARVNSAPQYRLPTGLRWSHNRDYIFNGGNEYRKFEILDVDRTSMGIERIDWDGNAYHAYVWPDEPRGNYVYDESAQGAFYIRNSDNIENDRLSDYVTVHFTLKTPPQPGDVYLNGFWTNGRFLPEYRMDYNDSARQYECAVLLKQGYYSYQYLLVASDGAISPVSTEGNYFQTRNNYQMFIYYRGQGERTDRLVGYQSVCVGD